MAHDESFVYSILQFQNITLPSFSSVDDSSSGSWLLPIVLATFCWALSDVCCDACIGVSTDVNKDNSKITGSQNAFISGCLCLGVGLSLAVAGESFQNTSPYSSAFWFAFFAGMCHFLAYLAVLKAFETVSSTVITPLLQFSALWMLPFTTLIAMFDSEDHTEIMKPIHLVAYALIIVGGLYPAMEGDLSSMATKSFWCRECVVYCLTGELLACFYNILLHRATYTATTGGAVVGMDVITFFTISRIGNGVTCVVAYSSFPWLRCQLPSLVNVGGRTLSVAAAGECISILGICIVMFSYSDCYEPSLVNAAEGGLQQLLNLIIALCSSRIFGVGRKVKDVKVKLVSFVLVSVGLYVATL